MVNMTTEDIKLRVQATLDELSNEHLIPFKLTAQRVNADGPGTYVVPFYDSRIHSFAFSWTGGESSLKEVVRAAVLDRVNRMNASYEGYCESRPITPQANLSNSKRVALFRFP